MAFQLTHEVGTGLSGCPPCAPCDCTGTLTVEIPIPDSGVWWDSTGDGVADRLITANIAQTVEYKCCKAVTCGLPSVGELFGVDPAVGRKEDLLPLAPCTLQAHVTSTLSCGGARPVCKRWQFCIGELDPNAPVSTQRCHCGRQHEGLVEICVPLGMIEVTEDPAAREWFCLDKPVGSRDLTTGACK